MATKLDKRRLERHKRSNATYAAQASKRVEEWMTSEAELPKAVAEPEGNPFHYEIRTRNKTQEINQGASGQHVITAQRYDTQEKRIAKAIAVGEMSGRGEFQETKFGESPFRKREKTKERHPALRFKDVSEAERINNATLAMTTGLGPGDDPLRDAQMGFDDIPVGMRPESVVVRAKAKAPGTMQFKRFFLRGPQLLNPRDSYIPDEYKNAPEATSYGFTKQNNFRPRRQEKEIDQNKMYLSTVKSKMPMGATTSKRADRLDPRVIDRPPRKHFKAAKTMLVIPGDEADEVVQISKDGPPETRTNMATRMLKNQNQLKGRFLEESDSCANGTNVYAWNELLKYKDHKM